MGVSKNRGIQNHPLKNRVFHGISHPFWGTIIFGLTPIYTVSLNLPTKIASLRFFFLQLGWTKATGQRISAVQAICCCHQRSSKYFRQRIRHIFVIFFHQFDSHLLIFLVSRLVIPSFLTCRSFIWQNSFLCCFFFFIFLDDD